MMKSCSCPDPSYCEGPAFREAVPREVICRGQVPRRVPAEGLPEPDSLLLPSSTSACSPMQITRSLICICTSSFPYPPALGGRALGLADSSPFCSLLPSRELLLSPSYCGWGRKSKQASQEKRSKKGTHPQDKETAAIWAAGREETPRSGVGHWGSW